MNNPTNTINIAALAALETLINSVLQLNSGNWNKLTSLSGKTIRVDIQLIDLPITVYIVIADTGIHLQQEPIENVDLQLSGSALSLLKLLTTEDKMAALFKGGIELSGDSELAFILQEIVSKLDIDWEYALAHLIGDINAHQLGKWMRHSIKWGSSIGQSMANNVNEYLHEELTLFPNNIELRDFYNKVDTLRLDTERLAARITRLSQTISELLVPSNSNEQ